MGLLDRFRRQEPAPANVAATWAETDAWLNWGPPQNLIREGAYQDEIAAICGPLCKEGYLMPVAVTLQREPRNRYDGNAVGAHVRGRLIGYLDAELAALVAPTVDRARIERWMVAGVIRGGSEQADKYGVHVWLDRLIEPGPEVNVQGDRFAVRWPPGKAELKGSRRPA